MKCVTCRVVGCHEKGNQKLVLVSDRLSGSYLSISPLWRHYAVVHGFWPHEDARMLVMRLSTDDASLRCELVQSAVPGTSLTKVDVLKVMDTSQGCDHEQGKIDWEFIQHLDKLLYKVTKKEPTTVAW